MVRTLVILMVAVVATSLFPEAVVAQTPPALSISGTVWFDANADGVRQVEDTGIPNIRVELASGPETRPRFAVTDAFGVYRFDDVTAGAYSLGMMAQANPYMLTYPTRTTVPPYVVALSITTASATGVDFGLFREQAAPIYRGLAWKDARPVNNPTVRAFIGGIDCTGPGEILPTDQPENTYNISVVSSAAISGCGDPGDVISFTINGATASQTAIWQVRPPMPTGTGIIPPPGSVPATPPWFNRLDLVIGHPFAYFFVSVVDDEGFSTYSAEVTALIDGKVCGRSEGFGFGGRIIMVPSREQVPGCGFAGAEMVLEVDGQPTGRSVTWLPHGALGSIEDLRLPRTWQGETLGITPPRAGDAGLVAAIDGSH